MNEHKAITVVDSRLKLVLDFCKLMEETFDDNQLTGINFTQTNDGKYVLGLYFKDDASWATAQVTMKIWEFEVANTIELQWIEMYGLTKYLILGNFTHKLMRDKV